MFTSSTQLPPLAAATSSSLCLSQPLASLHLSHTHPSICMSSAPSSLLPPAPLSHSFFYPGQLGFGFGSAYGHSTLPYEPRVVLIEVDREEWAQPTNSPRPLHSGAAHVHSPHCHRTHFFFYIIQRDTVVSGSAAVAMVASATQRRRFLSGMTRQKQKCTRAPHRPARVRC